jgi:ribosomal protein L29
MRKKAKKEPKDMTTDELAKHIFHPKVLRHVKKHIARMNEKPIKK